MTEKKRFENTYKDRQTYEIVIPGLTDIIHIKPRYQFNDEELEELKKPHKERDYSKFTKEGLEELERRREIAKRISKSPIPEWGKKLQRIINWIDDVEDVISTATTALEVVTVAVPSVAAVTAPLIATGELLSSVADLFNAAASLPLGPMGAKRAAGHLMDAALGRFKGLYKLTKNIERVKEIAKLAEKAGFKAALGALHSKREWIGKFLETAQVSDEFLGVGLCLGPVMGLLSDAFYGVIRKIEGKDVKIKVPWWSKEATSKALERHPEHKGFYKGTPIHDGPVIALKGLNAAARLLSIPQLQDGEVTLRAIIAANIASQVINNWIKGYDITDYIDLTAEVDVEPRIVERADSRGVIYDLGLDPDEPLKDPTSENIEPLKEVDYVVGSIGEGHKRVQEVNEAYEQDENIFTLNLITRSHYMVIPYFLDTSEEQEFKRELEPDRGIAEIALRHRVLPPESASLEEIDSFIKEGAAFYIARGRYPYQDEMEEIAYKTMGGFRRIPPARIPARYASLLGIAEDLETAKLPPIEL